MNIARNHQSFLRNTILAYAAAFIGCLLCSGTVGQAAPAQGALGRSNTHVEIYLTAKDTGQRLAIAGEAELVNGLPAVEKEEYIFVDPSKTFQTVLGIGGALTDASAETFYKLPEDKQRELLTAYFDPKNGIGYTLGRTHINSCDFSSDSYTYVKEGDKQLDSFDVAHDLKYRIPFIKAAMAKAGNHFTLFASPWSPPGWMKDNGDMLHGGKLKPEFYESWARYYGKFINAYEKEGVPIWGLYGSLRRPPLWSAFRFLRSQNRAQLWARNQPEHL